MKIKHRDFALTYIADPKRCAGRAYATAYGHDYESNRGSCDANGSRLLKHDKVLAFIKEKDDVEEKRITEKYQVAQDNVTDELAAIAFSNITDYVDFDNEKIIIKNVNSLTPKQTAAIKNVKRTSTKYGDNVELQLHDKRAALVDLGKHLGMFTQKVELDVADDLKKVFCIDRWSVERPGGEIEK